MATNEYAIKLPCLFCGRPVVGYVRPNLGTPGGYDRKTSKEALAEHIKAGHR